MALVVELVRECLNNVDDIAGRWQIEGGQVLDEDKKQVGSYSGVKQVSCGTAQQNMAQLWLITFLLGTNPLENITLHGAHDFNTGGEVDSVSAAPGAMAAQIGQQFSRVVNTLTIAWASDQRRGDTRMATISSAWAASPIATNGDLSAPEWAGAGKFALGNNGKLWVKNDAKWLYLALDMTPDPGGASDHDYFWLSIDVDGNRQITPHVDINYGPYPPGDVTLGRQYYLGPATWTGLSPLSSGEQYLQTVAPSPASPAPHRVWQMKLALSELGVDFSTTVLQTIAFGLRVASASGATTDYPPNFDTSFADLNDIVLATVPSPTYPPGTEGAVIAGVGFIPATLISAEGYATTPASYSLYPGLVDYAFYGTMQVKANHATVLGLWGQGARKYQLLLDGAPLLQSWNNYAWNGSTFVLETFAADAQGQYALYDPSGEYIVSDLLALWNSVGTAAGTHSLEVVFYEANGTTVVPAPAQALYLTIDNNLPLTVIDRTKTTYEGLPIAPCAIEPLGGAVEFWITAYSDLGHLAQYTLEALWDVSSAQIASDSYAPGHVSPAGWDGLNDVGPIPAGGWKPPQQCAYQFLLTAWMRTTNGVTGTPYTQDSRYVAFIAPS
jgi:hypothetical protein